MRFFSLSALVAITLAIAGPIQSAEVDPVTIGRIEKQLVPKLVSAVGDIGNGRIEAALGKFQELVGRKFQKSTGPFGQDERDVWRKMFTLFAKTPPRFESVDLITTQSVSTQSFRINLIANGERGPILFQFRAFEYRGKMRLANVHFDSNWNRMEAFVAAAKQTKFTRYPLPAEQTASKPKKTKRK